MKARARKLLSLSFILILLISTLSFITLTTKTVKADSSYDNIFWLGEDDASLWDGPPGETGSNKVYSWDTDEYDPLDYDWYDTFEIILWEQEPPEHLVDFLDENTAGGSVNTGLIPPGGDENDAQSIHEFYDDDWDPIDKVLVLTRRLPTAIKNIILSIPETIVDTFTGVFEYIESLVYDIEDWILNNFDDGKYGQAVAMPIAMTAVMAGLFLLVYGIIWIIGAIPVL